MELIIENKSFLKIGVAGFCPPSKFNEELAIRLIKEAFDRVERELLTDQYSEAIVVSGLTNVGVLKLAYEEASKRGWRTVGIACKKAEGYDLYDVDEKHIIGEEWGDESNLFVNCLNVIIKFGGGDQSVNEFEQVLDSGRPAWEYDLPLE